MKPCARSPSTTRPTLPPRPATWPSTCYRATSPRRDARAYAKALRDSLDSRAARGLPPVPTLDALTAAALDHAKGKGGGDDSHIEHRPAMDHALLLAYESGAEAEYLLTTHGMGAARRASVLDMECAPDPDERDTYANDKSLRRALRRARRPRDITRQCLEELTLLCDFLPQLTPPHLRPEALAAAARAQVPGPADSRRSPTDPARRAPIPHRDPLTPPERIARSPLLLASPPPGRAVP